MGLTALGYRLTEITLYKCSEIEDLPRLEHLPNLKSLFLYGLRKVRLINASFYHLTSLGIRELEALECLPEWLFYDLSSLVISNCRGLRELPDGLDTVNSFESLCIWDCENLKSIGNPSGGARQSQGILRELRISKCGELMELPCEMLELWAPTIEDLELEGLRRLKNLPKLIDCLAKSSTRLTYLTIFGVSKLMAANSGCVESWDLSSLYSLSIDVSVEWSREDSVGIAETVDGMLQTCSNSLTQLQLNGVENWEWLPQSIQNLTLLWRLELENIGVEELLGEPLISKYLNSCNKLKRLPSIDALKHLTKLEELYIIDCPELRIDSEWRNHHGHLKINVDDHPV